MTTEKLRPIFIITLLSQIVAPLDCFLVCLFVCLFIQAGVTNGGWGWGAAFVDFDNNGFLDIIMTSGKRSREHAYMFFKDFFLFIIIFYTIR